MFGIGKKNSNSASAKSLFDEQAKSDIILSAIDDGVVLIDSQRTIQLFNRGASEITGWDQKDALKIDYKMVIKLVDEKGEAYDAQKDPFELAFTRTTNLRDSEASLKTRNNKIVAISLSVSPLADRNNNIIGVVGVFRNVTNERQEQKQRTEFISTASHEMRTPVAAIEGYLALAMNEKVARIDTKAREYLEKAHSSTQHLGKLFQDLLTSAKAEDGRLQNHPKVLEMGEFLQKLIDDVRFTAEKKGLLADFVIGGEGAKTTKADNGAWGKMVKPLYYSYVDPDRIQEALVNLFDNAVKYTESGKISIGLTGDNSVVQIRVQDTGAGIPSEDIPHLFEKFYRVDSTATRTVGGTGLGLFITRKIIELYNGRIWVESQIGKGTTFFINLPRLANDKAQALQTQEANPLTNTIPNTITPNKNTNA